MSTAQGFARVRISQFHIVLACFSCILPEQGLHLRYTESCPRGRRCSTRNAVDRKVSRVRIPNSPPKTQSYQGFCPYDWAFLFSQGHISVHDFRQELRCASRSAPAASPAPPAGNRPQCTAASWGAPPCRRGEGKQIHFDGVFQCLVDYFFSRHPNLGKLGLTKGRIYAIHE